MEDLKITEYKNIRVLTTQQIAEAYKTDSKVISNNFNRNKERYTEGKHYICLEGQALKEFKTNHHFDESSKINRIYLWTEKGAFLHAKSLNTDIAWEVYDKLVDTYFNRPKTALEQLRLQGQAILEVNVKIDSVRQDLEDFKKTLPLLPADADKVMEEINKRVLCALGGKDSNAYHDSSLRGKVYSDIYYELKRQFDVTRYKDIKREQFGDAVAVIGDYELPRHLTEKIESCNAQMNLKEAI
ncbi:MAG: ORF6C domain-containing protein [Lachnospiraceae bacterium]